MPNEFIARNGLITLGNIGINTTTLQSGGASSRWITLNGSAGTYSGGHIYTIGDAIKMYHYVDNDSMFTHQATAGIGQKFFVSGSEAMRITSAGNVSIGNTNNTYKLDVTGIIRSSASIIRGGASSVSYLVFDATDRTSGRNYEIGSGYSNIGNEKFYIWDNTANAGRLVIDSSGNVGIGNTNPQSSLHVGSIITNNATYNGQLILKSGNSTAGPQDASGIEIVQADVNAGYGMKLYTNSATDQCGIATRHNTATWTPRLSISTVTGNVGIGVTPSAWDPTFKALQIGNRASVFSFNNNTTDVGSNVYYATDYKYLESAYSTIYRQATTTGQHQWYIAPSGTAGNPITFTQAMTLDANGRLGIGTTSPQYKLDVNGEISSTRMYAGQKGLLVSFYGALSQTISGQMTILGHNLIADSSAANTVLVLNSSWYSSMVRMYYNEGITFHTSTTVYNAGDVYPMASTERMRITSAGNVGIGTTSPSAPLHVNSSSQNVGIIIDDNSNVRSPTLAFYISGTIKNYIQTSNSNSDFIFGVNNVERMRITSGGNVGIGTTSPEAILHINKNNAGGEGAFLFIDNPAASTLGNKAGIRFATNAGATFANYGSAIEAINTNAGDGSEALTFSTWNGSARGERMRITSAGDIIVGNSAAAFASINRRCVEINGATSSILTLQVAGEHKGYVYSEASALYLSRTQAGGNLFVVNNSNGVILGENATSWTANSDIRLKNINGNIENAVDKLCTLRTVNFSWKSDATNKENLGLIAQDVEKVFPQVVDKNKLPSTPEKPNTDDTEYLGVRYSELVPVLIKAIQELKQEIEILKNK